MARLPTCPDCGIEIVDKTTAKKIGGRWVCYDCQLLRQQIQKDRSELYKYVATIFHIEYPTGMMMKQIKDFREELGYTYKGMTLSLKYWNETLEKTMINAKGVGIIPFIYEDAKKFYIEKMEVAKSIETIKDSLITTKTVQIHKQKYSNNKNMRKGRLIDMNNL